MVIPFLFEKLGLEPITWEFTSNSGEAFVGDEVSLEIPLVELEGELELRWR